MRRWFGLWTKRSTYREASQRFLEIFSSLQKQSVFRSLRVNVDRQEQVVETVHRFREDTAVKITFNAWRRVYRQKYALKVCIRNFENMEERFVILDLFRIWKKETEKQAKSYKMFQKAILMIADDYKNEALIHWKDFVARAHRKK